MRVYVAYNGKCVGVFDDAGDARGAAGSHGFVEEFELQVRQPAPVTRPWGPATDIRDLVTLMRASTDLRLVVMEIVTEGIEVRQETYTSREDGSVTPTSEPYLTIRGRE